jgi:hypothetical protein
VRPSALWHVRPRSVIGHGLVGHASQAPTPAATPQIDKRRNQRAAAARLKDQATVDASIKPRPREWTPDFGMKFFESCVLIRFSS